MCSDFPWEECIVGIPDEENEKGIRPNALTIPVAIATGIVNAFGRITSDAPGIPAGISTGIEPTNKILILR
jgi:hypothetical protein